MTSAPHAPTAGAADDLARPEHGAAITTSTGIVPAAAGRVGYALHWRDGLVPVGCYVWRDAPRPYWLELRWPRPRTIRELVVGVPALPLLAGPPPGVAGVRVLAWDRELGAWRRLDAAGGARGERRRLRIPATETTALRVELDPGPASWSLLGAIEVYEHAAPAPRGPERPARAMTRAAELREAHDWLAATASRLLAGCRAPASDGTITYSPDGAGGYDGMWVRDFAYMVTGHPAGVPDADVRDGFAFLVARQRADGVMPNKVRRDGVAVYCPGPGCGSVFGDAPPPDNAAFMVLLADAYVRRTGDLSLFAAHRAALVRAMRAVPRSPRTRLVHIDPERPSSPYGFMDAIALTGDLLFDSLLHRRAALALAGLLARAGDAAAAAAWEADAAAIAGDVQTLRDPASGMFLAASVDCRQIDVWGSAYAVESGALPPEQELAVARYLRANHDGLVRHGQVRHTAPGVPWQRTLIPNRDIYQDGAYWSVPSGWVAAALARVDRDLAERMLLDLVGDFRARGVNEAINPDIGYVAIPDYVVSATNPLPALRRLAEEARA